jgi:hypothetical protein
MGFPLNFAFTAFSEVRIHHFRKFAHFEPQIHSKFIARCFHGNHREQEADNGRTERCLI